MRNNYKGCLFDLGSRRILADQGRQHMNDVNGGKDRLECWMGRGKMKFKAGVFQRAVKTTLKGGYIKPKTISRGWIS